MDKDHDSDSVISRDKICNTETSERANDEGVQERLEIKETVLFEWQTQKPNIHQLHNRRSSFVACATKAQTTPLNGGSCCLDSMGKGRDIGQPAN